MVWPVTSQTVPVAAGAIGVGVPSGLWPGLARDIVPTRTRGGFASYTLCDGRALPEMPESPMRRRFIVPWPESWLPFLFLTG
jgi:hypothetical protein